MAHQHGRGPGLLAGRTVRDAGRGLAVVGLVLALIACTTPAAPERGEDPTTGFPIGVFAKEVTNPDLGRIRIGWTFASDGRWAEVPLSLDGQPQRAPVVRGTYRVDGDTVTIATSWPPGWGTSVHRWRLDGGDLWTVFVSSDVPDDADWFAALDTRPWRPEG